MTKTDEIGRIEESSTLSEKQNIALMALVSGKTDEEAGKAAGVQRQTVNEWKNNNPDFRTALINKRAEMWHGHQITLRESLTSAFDTINKAIKSGDVKTAQWLLEKINVDELAKQILWELKERPTSVEAEKEKIVRELAQAEAQKKVQAWRDTSKDDSFLPDPFKEEELKNKYFKEALHRIKGEGKSKHH